MSDSFSELSPEATPEEAIPERSEDAARSGPLAEGPTSTNNGNSAEESTVEEDRLTLEPSKLRDSSPYGSAFKRAARGSRKSRDTFTPNVPYWFLDRNVTLAEEQSGTAAVETTSEKDAEIVSPITAARTSDAQGDTLAAGSPSPSTDKNSLQSTAEGMNIPPTGKPKYQINPFVFEEIFWLAKAGLDSAPGSNAQAQFAGKPHLVLQSPKPGGSLFLEAVVGQIAGRLAADLIRVNAQDIAEISGDHMVDLPPSLAESLRTLGYETHIVEPTSESQGNVEGFDGFFEDGEDEPSNSRPKPIILPFPKPKKGSNQIKTTAFPFSEILKKVKSLSPSLNNQQSPPLLMIAGPPKDGPGQYPDTTESGRAKMIVDAFLNAPHIKALLEKPGQNEARDLSLAAHVPVVNGNQNIQMRPNCVILMIEDYLELCSTTNGSAVINMLHEVVDQKRANGQKILIIGTSSSEDLIPSPTREGFTSVQTDPGQPYHAVITPCTSADAESLFVEDEKVRVEQINTRHVLDVLRRSSPKRDQTTEFLSQRRLVLDSAKSFAGGLNDSVWSFEQVQRIAALALGIADANPDIQLAHEQIEQALCLAHQSDEAKFQWLDRNNKSTIYSGPNAVAEDTSKSAEERIKQLRKRCNRYEKKLLSGVVDAQSIRTTFDDVRVTPQTVEALQTLTTLSLVRPDAFTYGVLATDKIPGLLLYGPPGTGKTLLAKAVAKESGATVLEVAGSDVYDMYVGEGEKNVRAIFTLAKKLAPCVVFIDEADAIFGSRNTSGNRTSHRELINQFLREWDGMTDLSAFIMVATNRPFDLDDAVLRRLPRRLLVDLPTEKDREAILGIHLKSEVLDPAVSLQNLATRTPFYSGSDLKNISVAAALACVREENEIAKQAQGREGDAHESQNESSRVKRPSYPERRTLTQSHFEQALAEISASISEDMSSLAAIRKFDEKYGDRKGRRKKLGGWGFGTISEKEMEKERVEGGRVRSDEVQ